MTADPSLETPRPFHELSGNETLVSQTSRARQTGHICVRDVVSTRCIPHGTHPPIINISINQALYNLLSTGHKLGQQGRAKYLSTYDTLS